MPIAVFTACGALLVAATVAIACGWPGWATGCADSREVCSPYESFSGDHTFPQLLHRFGVEAPCGTRGLKYAYADSWNDDRETFDLRTSISQACLSGFLAGVAPGSTLAAAPLLGMHDNDFPVDLEGGFPNGVIGPLDPSHQYRVITATRPDGYGQVTLLVDTTGHVPLLEADFTYDAPTGWPEQSN
ncbi:hypothetical protein [Streptacidiphilus albus]|uniref:hypothetical protein n=1 Tax=Streptacidiphilus albus TaxID=105425 RepID=UPI00054BBBC3|nr:hypothetical protein [Streptacidiphilus albus]